MRMRFDRDQLSEDAQISYDLFELSARTSHREPPVPPPVLRRRSVQRPALGPAHSAAEQPQSGVGRRPAATTSRESAASRAVLGEFASKMKDRAEFGVIPPAFSFPAMLEDARAMSSGNAVRLDFEKGARRARASETRRRQRSQQELETSPGRAVPEWLCGSDRRNGAATAAGKRQRQQGSLVATRTAMRSTATAPGSTPRSISPRTRSTRSASTT